MVAEKHMLWGGHEIGAVGELMRGGHQFLVEAEYFFADKHGVVPIGEVKYRQSDQGNDSRVHGRASLLILAGYPLRSA